MVTTGEGGLNPGCPGHTIGVNWLSYKAIGKKQKVLRSSIIKRQVILMIWVEYVFLFPYSLGMFADKQIFFHLSQFVSLSSNLDSTAVDITFPLIRFYPPSYFI